MVCKTQDRSKGAGVSPVGRVRGLGARLMAEVRTLPARLQPGVSIGTGVRFGRGVTVRASGSARITIGDRVEIGAGTTLIAMGRGSIIIGQDVFISGSCIIAAVEAIVVGRESMLAEMVCVRDHDHDPDAPPRSGRVLSSRVEVGERVWLASKSSVVRGGSVGSDSVIGAHALVTGVIPHGVIAGGVPARVIRPRRPTSSASLDHVDEG